MRHSLIQKTAVFATTNKPPPIAPIIAGSISPILSNFISEAINLLLEHLDPDHEFARHDDVPITRLSRFSFLYGHLLA
ncbi:MAG: hypothetical protein E3I52_03875, partial [Candidatus Aminicenantes bacterium]